MLNVWTGAIFFLVAADGELLLGLPKVSVLRNDKREGEISILLDCKE